MILSSRKIGLISNPFNIDEISPFFKILVYRYVCKSISRIFSKVSLEDLSSIVLR